MDHTFLAQPICNHSAGPKPNEGGFSIAILVYERLNTFKNEVKTFDYGIVLLLEVLISRTLQLLRLPNSHRSASGGTFEETPAI